MGKSTFKIFIESLQGKKCVVMGLGVFTGGTEVTKYLVRQGADVLVTDLKGRKDLKGSLDALKSLPVRFRLGKHQVEDFRNADLVVVSPAVPHSSPLLREARAHGAVLETEMNLVFKSTRARIVGITGSNGKTTTTALTGAMLKTGKGKTLVGGNIGQSVINRAGRLNAGDSLVLELSSFQLDDLRQIKKSPAIAVITNIAPNHLDRHGSMRAYCAAKKRILTYQRANDAAVLNYDDKRVRSWAKVCKGKVYYFSVTHAVPRGAYLDGRVIRFRDGRKETMIAPASIIRLPGRHNVQNCLAAVAAARVAGVSVTGIRQVLGSFKGVEHRLELVRIKNGVTYYNDSIATTPESVIAALDALPEPIILIAGGYDKKTPFTKLGRAIARKTITTVLLGQTQEKIAREIKKYRRGKRPEIIMAGTFAQAVNRAVKRARKGDSVLLSPACASYDMFNNFIERGNAFKKAVKRL